MIEALGAHQASSVANAYIRALTAPEGRGRLSPSSRASDVAPSHGIHGKSELSEEERQKIEKLKQRHGEVRHELYQSREFSNNQSHNPTGSFIDVTV
jgi:hypothetical protein